MTGSTTTCHWEYANRLVAFSLAVLAAICPLKTSLYQSMRQRYWRALHPASRQLLHPSRRLPHKHPHDQRRYDGRPKPPERTMRRHVFLVRSRVIFICDGRTLAALSAQKYLNKTAATALFELELFRASLKIGARHKGRRFTALRQPYIPQPHANQHPMHSSYRAEAWHSCPSQR